MVRKINPYKSINIRGKEYIYLAKRSNRDDIKRVVQRERADGNLVTTRTYDHIFYAYIHYRHAK